MDAFGRDRDAPGDDELDGHVVGSAYSSTDEMVAASSMLALQPAMLIVMTPLRAA